MKIDLKYKGDEEFTSTNSNSNKVEIDMRASDQKQNQSPTELLLSALGACAAVEIVSMVKKRRKKFVDLDAEISGERRDEHPRSFTKIHLKYIITSPDLTQEEASRIVDLATKKYCSVAGSLSAEQTHSFEIKRD
ncbi:OsmC family protein [Ekhidna sp. To15]|uniref:OsmC family protein n=1 Tax=Ekhidna sp. To15 TaxID=3395267 RepID=UPI003F523BD8